MEKKCLVYLQQGFWNSIKERNSVEDKLLFWSIYGALQHDDVNTDIPKDEWINDELLYFLLQGCANGNGTKINFFSSADISQSLDSNIVQPPENLAATFLLDKNTMLCDGYAAELGVLCLNSSMIKKQKGLVYGKYVMFDKGEDGCFEMCKSVLSHSCNSAIIIDPYILSSKNGIDNNLIPILNLILPQTLKVTFHLSVYGQPLNGCNQGRNEMKMSADEIYSYIRNKIALIRPRLNVFFNLYHVKTTGNGNGDFHGRFIIMNNMISESRDGFDVFKVGEKGKSISGKNPTIESVCPALDRSGKSSKEYYRWIKICSKEKNLIKSTFQGSNNRLFELVK